MEKLGDFYCNYELIDIDTPGGYARVAKVSSRGQRNGLPDKFAFKLMRSTVDWEVGFPRFVEEVKILSKIFDDKNLPSDVAETITKIYDFGFVSVELINKLAKFEGATDEIPIMRSEDIKGFVSLGNELQKREPHRWCPYLVVELEDFEDCLLRQINRRPKNDNSGYFRLPTGEVVYLSEKLLRTLEYLHEYFDCAYIDWKPEHIYWNGMERKIKLIDWNVTVPLNEYPGKEQNIKDDVRLFCGAVLYSSLTFVNPDDGKPIGPQPTTSPFLKNPAQQIRLRYTTDDPIFYEASRTMDDRIKMIIKKGLHPKQGYSSPSELRLALQEYSVSEGISCSTSDTAGLYYWESLEKIRNAQSLLIDAYRDLVKASLNHGSTSEYDRILKVLKKTFENLPIP